MKIKKSLPVVVTVGGIFLIFLLLYFVFIPIHGKILETEMETKHLKAVEKILKEFERRHENFEEFAELTEENLNELKKSLPEKSSQEKFSAELYQSAEKNKIAVTILQVGEINSEENFQKQSVKIKVEGNYISILNFLRDIYDGERFAKLENISLESSKENFIICDAEFSIFSMKVGENS